MGNILGYSKEEVIGKTPFDFMSPEEAECVRAQFNAIIARKERIRNSENWFVTKDGGLMCLVTNGVPILDDKGNLVGYRGVDADITERKQAEKRQAEYTEELKKAKAVALSMMEDANQANQQLDQYVVALESANQASDAFREAAEDANRSKSEFLANMSHEIPRP